MTHALLIFNIIAGLILLLWVPLLGIGIYRLKRYGAKPGGIIMTVVGSIWGMGSVGLFLIGFLLYYQLQASSIAPFDPATYEGPTGKIKFPSSSVIKINASSDDGRFYYTETNGDTVKLPIGSYQVGSYIFERKDNFGNVWNLRISPNRSQWVELSEEKDIEMDMGPPLNMWISCRKKGVNSFSLSIKSKDMYGNQANLSSYSAGAPSFQILSVDDKVLLEGKFKYG